MKLLAKIIKLFYTFPYELAFCAQIRFTLICIFHHDSNETIYIVFVFCTHIHTHTHTKTLPHVASCVASFTGMIFTIHTMWLSSRLPNFYDFPLEFLTANIIIACSVSISSIVERRDKNIWITIAHNIATLPLTLPQKPW